jgi:hypothetical protein
MKVTIKAANIYGSMNYYGKKPRLKHPLSPITIKNYPKKGYITKIELGKFPKDVHIQYKLKGKRRTIIKINDTYTVQI